MSDMKAAFKKWIDDGKIGGLAGTLGLREIAYAVFQDGFAAGEAAKDAEIERLRQDMRDMAHEMRNSWGGDGWAGIQEKQWLDTVADRIEEVLTNHEQGKGDG